MHVRHFAKASNAHVLYFRLGNRNTNARHPSQGYILLFTPVSGKGLRSLKIKKERAKEKHWQETPTFIVLGHFRTGV